MANLTLINIKGEVAGEIRDVMNAVVHAFMRMSEVKLKPSCHIINHNVDAVAAYEKLMHGRFKMMEELNKMTEVAAKDTGLETKYKKFNDVIKFKFEDDVYEFVDLWNLQWHVSAQAIVKRLRN